MQGSSTWPGFKLASAYQSPKVDLSDGFFFLSVSGGLGYGTWPKAAAHINKWYISGGRGRFEYIVFKYRLHL